jgi:hypothetical protein
MRTAVSVSSAILLSFVAGCSSTAPNGTDAGNATDAAMATDSATRTDAPNGNDGALAVDAASTSDGGVCHMPSDLSGIGAHCGAATECPADYVCQDFEGAVLSMSCQIRCDPTGCPCPTGTSCNMHDDKRNMPWHQCDLDA